MSLPDPVRSAFVAVAAPFLGARDAYRTYHPAPSKLRRTPADRGLPLRTASIRASADGLGLDAWIVPGDGPHTVVVCHGMMRTKASVLDHVALLHEAGHHVVAFDMRNHGASGRDRRVHGMAARFTSDVLDVVGHVRSDPELGGGKLAMLAFSFSTWPALYALREPGARIVALACDSGPAVSIPGAFRHFSTLRRKRMQRVLARQPMFALYASAYRLCGTLMLGRTDWPPDLRGLPTRLLFVTGARDEVVPPASVAATASHYPGAELWIAPSSIHLNAHRMDRAEYSRRLIDFFDRALRGIPERSGRWAHD
jgi:pimeloyl-ACP methyl ester carboxylesterase